MSSKIAFLHSFCRASYLMRAVVAGIATIGVLVLFAQSGGISRAAPRTDVGAFLNPVWTTGILSDGVGPHGIVVTDLNLDNVSDTLTCTSQGNAYDLVKSANGYDTRWFSQALNCSRIAVGDRDGNGHREVYVGTSDSTVLLYSGDDFSLLGQVNLPGSGEVKDLGVANVDNDPQIELVIVREDSTFVYDATTRALEWNASGKGGAKLGIGNIDGDSQVELVVNGNPAHILDASTQTQKWAYSGGFGIDMALGNVDGDVYDEIGYVIGGGYSDGSLYAFDADTLTNKWHYDGFGIQVVAIADADGNGTAEVIGGDGQWGSVHGHSGLDGAQIWNIGNPEHGVFGIGVGDTDNDSVNEVVWGAGLSSSGEDALFIGNWDTESVEWKTVDLDAPLLVATGDVDNDGHKEIVLASNETVSGYEGGTIAVYDAATFMLEWSVEVSGSFWRIDQLAVGQEDADPQLEIIVAGENWYDARVNVFDGIARASQWQSAILGNYSTRSLLVANVDADPLDEIIVGLDSKVNVFNGASDVVQWESDPLDGAIRDLALGDVDGDSNAELAVLTDAGIYSFQASSFAQEDHQPIALGRQVAVANSDLTGAGELLLTTTNDNGSSTLQKWAGSPLGSKWSKPLGNVTIKDIAVGDLDGDGIQEFLLGGLEGDAYDYHSKSFLLVGSQINGGFVIESNRDVNYGPIQNIVVADVGDGGANEVLLGNVASVQVNKVTTGPYEAPTPTPTHVPTITPTASPTPGGNGVAVKRILFEKFDKKFPSGLWKITKGWGQSNCKAYSGKFSAWAIKKTGAVCGDSYDNNQKHWMVYGPFSLDKAKAADVYFKLWLNAEQNKDSLFVGASVNGNNFYGVSYTGTTPGTNAVHKAEGNAGTNEFTDGGKVESNLIPGAASVDWASAHFDLTNVYKLGNLKGKQKVWIAFVWRSDGQNTLPYGAFVDDVLITKTVKKK